MRKRTRLMGEPQLVDIDQRFYVKNIGVRFQVFQHTVPWYGFTAVVEWGGRARCNRAEVSWSEHLGIGYKFVWRNRVRAERDPWYLQWQKK